MSWAKKTTKNLESRRKAPTEKFVHTCVPTPMQSRWLTPILVRETTSKKTETTLKKIDPSIEPKIKEKTRKPCFVKKKPEKPIGY